MFSSWKKKKKRMALIHAATRAQFSLITTFLFNCDLIKWFVIWLSNLKDGLFNLESSRLQSPMHLKLCCFLSTFYSVSDCLQLEAEIKNWKEGERIHLTKKGKKKDLLCPENSPSLMVKLVHFHFPTGQKITRGWPIAEIREGNWIREFNLSFMVIQNPEDIFL